MKGRGPRAVQMLFPVAAVCMALLAHGQGTEAPEPIGKSFHPPGGALIAPGRAPDLILLYTGDVLGFLDPCG